MRRRDHRSRRVSTPLHRHERRRLAGPRGPLPPLPPSSPRYPSLRPRNSDSTRHPGWGATEVVTGATELATVQLGEGSVVRLAPSSRLRVLAGRERAVHLEGRAFFAVERMPTPPATRHTRRGRRPRPRHPLRARHERGPPASFASSRGQVALSTPREHIEVGRRRGGRRAERYGHASDTCGDTDARRDVGRDVPRVSGDAVRRRRP